MKGLLLKDWYLSVKYYKPYLLVLFVFAVMSVWSGYNPFLINYPFMLIGMMAPGLQNIDEGFKWDVYCGSMPCSRKQIVCEKYLYGLIWSALGLLIITASQCIRMLINGGILWEELLYIWSVCLFLIFFLPAISLPFVFRFGAEKGRITQYLIIGMCVGLAVFMGVRSEGQMPVFSGNGGAMLGTLVIPLTLYAFSWWLSIRFYEKREIR